MWLLLPDEDVSVDDLLTDSEALGFITAKKKNVGKSKTDEGHAVYAKV